MAKNPLSNPAIRLFRPHLVGRAFRGFSPRFCQVGQKSQDNWQPHWQRIVARQVASRALVVVELAPRSIDRTERMSL